MVLTQEQKVLITITALTLAGNPARFDGNPSFESSNPTVASVIPHETDANSAWVVAGALGGASVSATVDADLGEGVSSIVGYLDVTVIEAGAAVVQIVAGEPVLK